MARGMGGKSPVNVAHYLSGINFPCDKDDLVEHAKGKNADSEVLETLEDLPKGEYANMADVMKGYGEERRHEA